MGENEKGNRQLTFPVLVECGQTNIEFAKELLSKTKNTTGRLISLQPEKKESIPTDSMIKEKLSEVSVMQQLNLQTTEMKELLSELNDEIQKMRQFIFE